MNDNIKQVILLKYGEVVLKGLTESILKPFLKGTPSQG